MLTSSLELNFIVKKPSEYDLSETLILNFENRLLRRKKKKAFEMIVLKQKKIKRYK